MDDKNVALILEQLSSIAGSLKILADATVVTDEPVEQITGLVDNSVVPKPLHLKVNPRTCDNYFYFDENSAKVDTGTQSLHGRIVKVERIYKAYKEADREMYGPGSYHLRLHIMADKLIIVEAGFDSAFARSALLQIPNIEDYQQPHFFTISVGDRGSFCRIISEAGQGVDEMQLGCKWKDYQNWQGLFELGQSLVSEEPAIVLPEQSETEPEEPTSQGGLLSAFESLCTQLTAAGVCPMTLDDVTDISISLQYGDLTQIQPDQAKVLRDAVLIGWAMAETQLDRETLSTGLDSVKARSQTSSGLITNWIEHISSFDSGN